MGLDCFTTLFSSPNKCPTKAGVSLSTLGNRWLFPHIHKHIKGACALPLQPPLTCPTPFNRTNHTPIQMIPNQHLVNSCCMIDVASVRLYFILLPSQIKQCCVPCTQKPFKCFHVLKESCFFTTCFMSCDHAYWVVYRPVNRTSSKRGMF